ncbi:MAG: Holliday junction branch migration protein RuvA [Ardenticatenia bacterium]|nr:Holliday junction branch migration protein RuvA [Ardenticatenia bacterium]
MIGSLEGTLLCRQEDWILLDVGGVGYRVHVPPPLAAQMGSEGERVRLYTHLHVRENELSLYGFRTSEELELFELLLAVSGVGPKVALAFLATYDPATIVHAIANEQHDLLTRVPGVGARTARRVVLELKSKVERLAAAGMPATDEADAVSALTALGYSVREAQAALRGLPANLSLEEKIFRALQRLSE